MLLTSIIIYRNIKTTNKVKTMRFRSLSITYKKQTSIIVGDIILYFKNLSERCFYVFASLKTASIKMVEETNFVLRILEKSIP